MTLTITRALNYAAALGNHVLTTRATYTVPTGQSAKIEYITLRLVESVATGVNVAAVIVVVQGVNAARLTSHNVIDDREIYLPCSISLDSGETVLITTVNGSVNTLTFESTVYINEYQ